MTRVRNLKMTKILQLAQTDTSTYTDSSDRSFFYIKLLAIKIRVIRVNY